MRPEPVVIGRIGRPHGVRGAVRARATGPTLATIAPGDPVEIAPPPPAPPRTLALRARQGSDDRPILLFDGVESREAAAALTGALIRVDAARVAALDDPDTYYVRDLIGCEVLLGDREAGVVTDVHEAPANDVLEIAGPDGELLVPFTADAVVRLDLAGRRIVVRPDLLDV